MSQVEIRLAGHAELDTLGHVFEEGDFLADRLNRQKDGLGKLLVAWVAERPVGIVYLWLEEAEEREIRRHLPGVPLLTHLEVMSSHRNQGIGQMLLRTGERTAAELGHRQVALAVRTDNVSAYRLYRRMGYEDFGFGTVTCYAQVKRRDGRIRRVPEPCHVLVKTVLVDRGISRTEYAGRRPARPIRRGPFRRSR